MVDHITVFQNVNSGQRRRLPCGFKTGEYTVSKTVPSLNVMGRDARIFQQSISHLKILGARRVT
jgi:hypothetical protein